MVKAGSVCQPAFPDASHSDDEIGDLSDDFAVIREERRRRGGEQSRKTRVKIYRVILVEPAR